MLESCLEVYARHILFLKLLTESSEQMGIQGKETSLSSLWSNTSKLILVSAKRTPPNSPIVEKNQLYFMIVLFLILNC